MGRVTTEEVLSVITTDKTDATIFIAIANELVNSVLGTSTTLSDTTLKYIELYLAAHFLSVDSPQVSSEKIGNTSISYNIPNLGEALKATTYGQQALALDTTGLLAARGKRKAGLIAIDLGL